VLLAGVVVSTPRNLNPANGRPHVTFLLRADGDKDRIWKISARDETELGMERVALGDVLAIVGILDVGVEKGRISYKIEARQVLFLRNRSVARAAPALNGFVRSRVG
jgi:hypothetical protein